MTSSPTRPLVRYHGGKWMLAKWIISHFPRHRVYVEPFGGAASVLLQKPRSYAEVYNDLDGDVVNLFRVVRDRAAELTRSVHWTPWSRREFELAYEPAEEPLEQARRFIVRAFMGFGTSGLMSGGRTGFRAVPYRVTQTGVHDWKNYPPSLERVAERLRGVTIEHKAAEDVIVQQDSTETLFYCDPPYVHATRSTIADSHRSYRHEMSNEDHEVLADHLRSADGMVLLSGYRGEIYDLLYHDWQRVERPALADGAAKRTEVLWMNPQAAAAAADMPLFGDPSTRSAEVTG